MDGVSLSATQTGELNETSDEIFGEETDFEFNGTVQVSNSTTIIESSAKPSSIPSLAPTKLFSETPSSIPTNYPSVSVSSNPSREPIHVYYNKSLLLHFILYINLA